MPPLSLMIKPVSSLCNMRCGYCFYSDVSKRREHATHGLMTPDTLEVLVRRAFAYADDHVSFAFQGGEPTLAGAAFYRELLRLQRKYNTRGLDVHNAIQTNGLVLEDELVDVLEDGEFLVGISLDGTREIHDRLRTDAAGQPTYDRVIDTIEKLSERFVEVNILCVVNRYVAKQPEAVFRALAKYRYIQFIPCLDDFDGAKSDHSLSAADYGEFLCRTFEEYRRSIYNGRYISVRTFDNYMEMMKDRPPENCAMRGRCGVYYLIEADGGVYPCDFYVLDSLRMGNIRDASFASFAKSPIAEAFRAASFHESPDCLSCHWTDLCRGGCRRDREPLIDGKPSLNRFCGAFKRFFEYAYPAMEELAREIN